MNTARSMIAIYQNPSSRAISVQQQSTQNHLEYFYGIFTIATCKDSGPSKVAILFRLFRTQSDSSIVTISRVHTHYVGGASRVPRAVNSLSLVTPMVTDIPFFPFWRTTR
ncbi:uncharacterized protein EAF01_005333 [Botrytis porri]|uniref:uncharacterized protein n=1 Tax=Botrytis porri TaxID=87229 RepID=UPI001900E5DB|nr:uncharacterized protein EAF01_005333 [Botrytis porri]KAF7907747.1 hypothetical protein EAF01_005333 [Botrytis porri]